MRAILLCIAACTVATGALKNNDTATTGANVCTSMECQNIASDLLKTIDQTIDPCEDFYQFACGTYLNSPPVDEDEIYVEILRYEIFFNIESLIVADIKPDDPYHANVVKTLYQSCMNSAAIEAKGLEPLRKHLRDLGGWPVVEGSSWNNSNFDWRRTVYNFRPARKYEDFYFGDNVGHLFHFAVTHSKTIPIVPMMTLTVPFSILMPSRGDDSYYQNETFLKHYLDSMVRIATQLGADEDRARTEIAEIISFEQSLTKIKLLLPQGDVDDDYNPLTIAQLEKEYQTVPWMTYIRTFVPERISVSKEELINVPDPNYYVQLEALMAGTPKRVQANYIMSRIALRNGLFLTESMRNSAYNIITSQPRPPQARNGTYYCIDEVMEYLWQGVTAMYKDKYWDAEAKDAANKIAMNLEWQLRMKLVEYPWSNNTAWKLMTDKFAVFENIIGYPDGTLDHLKLQFLYEDLEFTRNDYYGNMFRLLYHEFRLGIQEFQKSSKELNKAITINQPLDMATRYEAYINTIYISFIHLRGRFFDKDRPKYMNYGMVGNIISHELTHAFFERSFYQTPTGNIDIRSGLLDAPEFASRAECLIKQYESFRVDDIGTKLDGRKTLKENLADVGGIRLAYDAYNGWAAVNLDEQKLPGFERYSAKQMFWIGSAVVRCEKITSKTVSRRIQEWIHSMGKFRVIGMLSNMPEFAQDFQCRTTSLMNPVKRCAVWHNN